MKKLSRWVKTTLGPDVPVHLTRFHPEYQLKHLPPTPYSTLQRGYDIARAAGLHFPYVGNLAGVDGENTICPKCHKSVIARQGFSVTANLLQGGKCPGCGQRIPGLWTPP
jgi:pyruvate formate lyase activating enzyme